MSSHPSPKKISEQTAWSRKPRFKSMAYGQRFMSMKNGASASEHRLSPIALVEGLLRVIWKGETPHFTFSQVQGEDYAAIPRKMNPEVDRDLDCVYFLYMMQSGGKVNHADSLFSLQGMMAVSSRATYDSGITEDVETEFILYDCSNDGLVEKQSPSSNGKLPNMVLHGFWKDRLHQKKISKHHPTEYSSHFEPLINELKLLWQRFDPTVLIDHLQPNLELAAVVIRGHNFNKQKVSSGGWGLKFLQNHVDVRSRLSSDLSVPMQSCITCGRGSARRIDALIPSGFHCFQESETLGPSNLIERWRSGRCDCGGWDLCCPFSVLTSWAADESVHSEEESQEDCGIVNLFKEGHRRRHPSIRVETIHQDLYIVHFRSNMSPIQSFSIALSLIHSHIMSLCPNL